MITMMDGDDENSYSLNYPVEFFGKPEGKRPLGRPRRR
jgi:hypothetical protein